MCGVYIYISGGEFDPIVDLCSIYIYRGASLTPIVDLCSIYISGGASLTPIVDLCSIYIYIYIYISGGEFDPYCGLV